MKIESTPNEHFLLFVLLFLCDIIKNDYLRRCYPNE